MSTQQPRIITDPEYGFRRLEPTPSADDLSDFYQSKYYDLMRRGDRSPDLRRHLRGGQDQEAQNRWQARTVFDTVVNALGYAPGRTVLEIGSGVGTLVKHLADAGFDALGVDPAPVAVEAAVALGVDVRVGDYASYCAAGGGQMDAIVMLNVLEHVPDPVGLLRAIHDGLKENGLVIIRVPNDFSEVQAAALAKLTGDPWWIAIPDHINYFNFETLPPVLTQVGFEVLDTLGDFPMELFLLMGRDYTRDPAVGRACHGERVSLEMSLPPEQLRGMYRALASVEVGRNCFFVARKAAPSRVDIPAFKRTRGGYRYVGLRHQDIQEIRRWRNEQQDVLRQKNSLTRAEQQQWWETVVTPTHRSAHPSFLLVSILDGDSELVGYGGLTNIDWDHLRAEVSFLVSTERAADAATYEVDILAFLDFLKAWAFEELGLHRLFTETYAFRRVHIELLERAGMDLEGRMRDHVDTDEGFLDSFLHGIRAPLGKR